MSATAGAGRTIRIRGLEIFVRESGKGFPLLIINGIGASVDMLTDAETEFAQRSRTIVFDAPGTGRSSTPIFPQPIVSVARIARDLVDELGYAQADVLGFSHGGLVAQELARVAPERVRRLALVSTACGWGSRLGDPAVLAVLATPLRYYSRSFDARTSELYGERDRAIDTLLRDARVPAARGGNMVEPAVARVAAAADTRDRGRRRPHHRACKRRAARAADQEQPPAPPSRRGPSRPVRPGERREAVAGRLLLGTRRREGDILEARAAGRYG